jgi:16S rRNA (cytosine967-C5)-methyltransferase
MNEPAEKTERDDGYVQDRASQWVAALVAAQPQDRVLDLCAAPGGKASAIPATVIAADVRATRARVMKQNGLACIVVADGRAAPFPSATFDRVLVDAPCSGLGALRRRPDARWRIQPGDVERLAALQRELVDAAVTLLRPGGVLVYSVCTLTRAESLAIDEHLAAEHPQLVPLEPPGEPWQPWARGGLLLPQTAGTDGMTILRLRSPADG